MSRSLHKGWKVEYLKDIADVIMGQSPPSSTYNQKGVGLPFFQGKTEFGDTTPSVTNYCSDPIKIAEKNDILMSVRAPVGPVNICPQKCCIGRGLSAIRAKEGKANYLYLFFYLRSIEEKIANFGQGSTFKAINKSNVEHINVPTPRSVEIQKKIASILNRASELRQKREKANQVANTLLQAVFMQMFGHLLRNPNSTTIKKLKEVSKLITKGESPLWKGDAYQRSGIPIIRIKNIKNHRIVLDDADYITKAVHDRMRRSQLHPNDVVLSIAGTLGRSALVTADVCPANMNQDQALIRLDQDIVIPAYIVHALSTDYVKQQISSIKRGATRLHLNLQQVGNLEIPIPEKSLQDRFVKMVIQIENIIAKQKLSTNELNVLSNSLVSKAFKGELVQ
jgi:type I restriction enzyme S subunit